MAKFTFPIDFEQFVLVCTGQGDASEVFAELGDAEEPMRFAYSCLRQGWMSKQHHKETQEKKNEEMRVMRKLMRDDPELKKRLLEHDRKQAR